MGSERPDHGHFMVDIGAIAKVIEAYKNSGYEVLLGNPDCLATRLLKHNRLIEASFAISMSDILVFQWIAWFAPWKRALIIGNSFGFSTLLIAGLCPGCDVDAIDAEIEGSENRLGSQLTMAIAREDFPGVRLTIGFSPQDLPQACRFDAYDLIFIDGFHTNDQLIGDFGGICGRREGNSVVYLHDVGMAQMTSAWSTIKSKFLTTKDSAFDLNFTSFGTAVVIYGYPELKRFMETSCRPLEECFYYFGGQHLGIRSALHALLRTVRYSTRLGQMFQSISR